MVVTRTRVRGRRQPVSWSGIVAGGFTAVPASSKVLLASFIPNYPGGSTVRRLRGTFLVISDQTAAPEAQNGAIGACVVGDTAVGVGISAIKDPVTDVSDDTWFWYHSFNFVNPATVTEGQATRMIDIDSKAMRKVQIGDTVVFVIANASATAGLSVAMSVRLLGSETSS